MKPRRTEHQHGQLNSWTWHIPGVGRLSMWDAAPATGRLGHLSYTFRPAGCRNALFSGDDFKPSPMHAVDSLDTALALADFLCLGRGDTDAEYFESYNASQLRWLESSERESAQMVVYDLQYPHD